ncbi:hypothetical protein BKA80DRAFT_265384 [Phyllosticta citrichinensis]
MGSEGGGRRLEDWDGLGEAGGERKARVERSSIYHGVHSGPALLFLFTSLFFLGHAHYHTRHATFSHYYLCGNFSVLSCGLHSSILPTMHSGGFAQRLVE